MVRSDAAGSSPHPVVVGARLSTTVRPGPKSWHLLLLTGLTLVLSAVAWRGFDPEIIPGYSDFWDYLQLGRQLAGGHGFTSLFTYPIFLPWSGAVADGGLDAFPMLWRPPLYPAMVASGLLLSDGSVWAPIAINILAHLAAVLATYALALEFTGRRWALLSGLVVALSPELMGLDEPGLATTPYTALLVLAVRAVLKSDGRSRAGAAGVAFGLLMLMRGEALLILPAMIWLLWAGERGDRERRIWSFLILAIVVTIPWTIRNWMVTGRPFFGSSSLLFLDTHDYPGWISSRMTVLLDRSALLWALSNPDQVSWKALKNLYHFLVQALLLPLAALAPFVWTAAGRLARVGRESAYCASVLIALGLTILALAPLEYSPRFLYPFIPLLTVVGVIILGRMREQIGEGQGVRYSRRPVQWVAAAVITLAALQFLGGLRDARHQRTAWAGEFGPLKETNWSDVTTATPSGVTIEADYPAYYAWKTGRRFLWWRADCSQPAPGLGETSLLAAPALLARDRGKSFADPMGIESSADLVARALELPHEVGAVLLLAARPCP